MTCIQDLDKIFTYQAPNVAQKILYQNIRNVGYVMAQQINDDCPASNEKEIALEKLREAVMWANTSIALNSDTGQM